MARDTQIRRTGLQLLVALMALACGMPLAHAAGTVAGTVIESAASVEFVLGGNAQSATSNTVSFRVAERIDVVVALQSAPVVVSPDDVDRSLLFSVTNTGNGDEAFRLDIDSLLAGDDFDPVPATPDAIFFDTDGSGDLSLGDVAYAAGTNDPDLGPDESVDVLLVNGIPGTVADGHLGRSELSAMSVTGSGAPGTVLAGLGDNGIDAALGTSGGVGAAIGEYLVDDVDVSVVKSQAVLDPDGGSEPVTGATITYTITVEVIGPGTAGTAAIRDLVPTWSSFVPGSITLNGTAISDASDADAGEYDTSGAPTVVVRLGDLTEADGVQTVTFQVQII